MDRRGPPPGASLVGDGCRGMVAPGLMPAWRKASAALGWRDLLEVALIGAAFSLYFAVRSAVVGRPETAYTNALDIIGLQQSLGLFWEDDGNRWTARPLF